MLHPRQTDSVMDEDPMPEDKKTFWKAFWILVVIGGAIGILIAFNKYWGKPTKTERFIDSIEKIQDDVHKMRQAEEQENKK